MQLQAEPKCGVHVHVFGTSQNKMKNAQQIHGQMDASGTSSETQTLIARSELSHMGKSCAKER